MSNTRSLAVAIISLNEYLDTLDVTHSQRADAIANLLELGPHSTQGDVGSIPMAFTQWLANPQDRLLLQKAILEHWIDFDTEDSPPIFTNPIQGDPSFSRSAAEADAAMTDGPDGEEPAVY